MSASVLDASALIALLQQEPGAGRVADAMTGGFAISAANFAEVVTKLAERGLPEDAIREFLQEFEASVVDLDTGLAYSIGLLRPHTRQQGLSLGDRACLALARRLGLPAVTTDRTWRNLDIGVQVVTIR